MSGMLEIFVDGACSGNPGPAGIGVVIREDGQVIQEISRFIGEGTNNIAEYSALICALQEALILKAEKVHITTDSELVFKQVTGQYKVKHPVLKPLFDQVLQLIKGFKDVELKHTLRENNKEADRLATTAVSLNSKFKK